MNGKKVTRERRMRLAMPAIAQPKTCQRLLT